MIGNTRYNVGRNSKGQGGNQNAGKRELVIGGTDVGLGYIVPKKGNSGAMQHQLVAVLGIEKVINGDRPLL